MVTRLLPHIRQFVRVRQALVRASARTTTVTALLDNPRKGIVKEDQVLEVRQVPQRCRNIPRASCKTR